MFADVARIRNRTTGRFSSWDTTRRNADYWVLSPGKTRVLADIQGPGSITHIWSPCARWETYYRALDSGGYHALYH